MILPLFLLLLFAACTGTSPWRAHHLQTGDKAFDSSKLTYTTADTRNNIELEFLKTADVLHLYLQVYSSPVPAYRGDPSQALIMLSTEKEKIETVALRHEGGERVQLTDALRDKLIAWLLAGEKVTISLQGYVTTLEAADFKEKFAKMQHPPFFSNPFKLPF